MPVFHYKALQVIPRGERMTYCFTGRECEAHLGSGVEGIVISWEDECSPSAQVLSIWNRHKCTHAISLLSPDTATLQSQSLQRRTRRKVSI